MHNELSLSAIKKEWHGSMKAYAIGFIGSIVLTGISFSLVIMKILNGKALVFTLVGLALMQAVVQLIFFLHVGQEAKPRWETLVFCFMLTILMIVAAGSLWIMYDLDNRVMADMVEVMPHD